MRSPSSDLPVRPPRAAEWFVRRIGRNAPWRETELGDLREEHAAVARARGRVTAAAWYWRQTIALAAETIRNTLRTAGRGLISFLSIGDRPMLTLLQEIRFASRALRRQKLVAGAVVVTIALGLGANATAISMFHVLVWHPFPFDNVDRLVTISETSPRDSYPLESVAPANFLDWRRESDQLDRMAALLWWDVNFSGGDEPERVHGFRVSPAMFDALEIRPAVGRLLFASDEADGAARVVVLGDGLWHRRFGGRADVVGQSVQVDGQPYEIVGVAPRGFNFPLGAELWSALQLTPDFVANRKERSLTVIGHLRPGAAFPDARAQVGVVAARLKQAYPAEDGDYGVRVQTLAAGMTDPWNPAIIGMIQAGALMVLLIGSANIANLLIACGYDRQREIALRLALGGSRGRLVRQLLIESALMGAVAVPASLGVSWVVLRAVKGALPVQVMGFVPGWQNLGVDSGVVAVTVAGAIGAAVLFALFPALQTSKPELTQALREGGRTMSAGRSRQRMRRTFVIAELALALPLLVAAGLAASGAFRFANGPQGYDPRGVQLVSTTLTKTVYADETARRQFTERFVEEGRRTAGVVSAATINSAPTSNSSATRAIDVDGQPPPDPAHRPEVMYRVVSPQYFGTLRIPFNRGRDFTPADRADSQPVAIVSHAMAERFWPGENPVGRRVRIVDDTGSPWMTIVAETGDTIDDWFDRRNSPAVYVPMAQHPSFAITLVARTDGDPTALVTGLRQALHAADPNQPASLVTTLSQSLHDRTAGLKMISTMMAGLGGLALVLAAVGIYSLMAYYVSQRHHEMGVRMALGASRRDVVRLVLTQSGQLSAVGLAIGVVLAIGCGRLVTSVLFGLVSLEPAMLGGLTLALAATALVACAVPARRAARIDPAAALRGE
jgi:putative ABC transport system permease protein